ncbi:MAG: caspase family protein, partial [Thermoplasmata archaeon]
RVPEATEQVETAQTTLLALPDTAFSGNATQQKNTLDNKYEAVANMLEAGNTRGAVKKMKEDIRPKTEGIWVSEVTAIGIMKETNMDIMASMEGPQVTIYQVKITSISTATVEFYINWGAHAYQDIHAWLYTSTDCEYETKLLFEDTELSLSGLSQNVEYTIIIKATAEDGTSGTASKTFIISLSITNVVVDILQDGVRFEWDTTVPTAENTVRVWNGGYDRTFAEVDPAIEKTHHISPIFSGLQKNMVYNYRITANTVTFYSTFPLPDLYIYDVVVSATENSATITWKTNINTDTMLWWKVYKPDWDGYGWYRYYKTESTTEHTAIMQNLNPGESYDYYLENTAIINGQVYTVRYGSTGQPFTVETKTTIEDLAAVPYYDPTTNENGIELWWETPGVGNTQLAYTIEVHRPPKTIYQTTVSLTGERHRYKISEKVAPLERNVEYEFSVSCVVNGEEIWDYVLAKIPDTDSDGLTDVEELYGWEVELYLWMNPCDPSLYLLSSHHVISQPGVQDADKDGWNDKTEKEHRTDPSPSSSGGGGGGGRPPLICSISSEPLTSSEWNGKDTDNDGIIDSLDYRVNPITGEEVRSPVVTEIKRYAVVVGYGYAEYVSLGMDAEKWKDMLYIHGFDVHFFWGDIATKGNIQGAINSGISLLNERDLFVLVIVGHGEGESETNGCVEVHDDVITSSELKSWFDNYNGYLMVFITACHAQSMSGVYVNAGEKQNKRVFISSCMYDEVSYAHQGADYTGTVWTHWFVEKGINNPDCEANMNRTWSYYRTLAGYFYCVADGYINDPVNHRSQNQKDWPHPICRDTGDAFRCGDSDPPTIKTYMYGQHYYLTWVPPPAWPRGDK